MKKKLIVVLLCFSMLGVSACGTGEDSTTSTTESTIESEAQMEDQKSESVTADDAAPDSGTEIVETEPEVEPATESAAELAPTEDMISFSTGLADMVLLGKNFDEISTRKEIVLQDMCDVIGVDFKAHEDKGEIADYDTSIFDTMTYDYRNDASFRRLTIIGKNPEAKDDPTQLNIQWSADQEVTITLSFGNGGKFDESILKGLSISSETTFDDIWKMFNIDEIIAASDEIEGQENTYQCKQKIADAETGMVFDEVELNAVKDQHIMIRLLYDAGPVDSYRISYSITNLRPDSNVWQYQIKTYR